MNVRGFFLSRQLPGVKIKIRPSTQLRAEYGSLNRNFIPFYNTGQPLLLDLTPGEHTIAVTDELRDAHRFAQVTRRVRNNLREGMYRLGNERVGVGEFGRPCWRRYLIAPLYRDISRRKKASVFQCELKRDIACHRTSSSLFIRERT
jgi:hypothetical protein